MMTNRNSQKASAEKTVRDIRRATRKRYSAEEKIRIVLEGLRGEVSIAEQVTERWLTEIFSDRHDLETVFLEIIRQQR